MSSGKTLLLRLYFPQMIQSKPIRFLLTLYNSNYIAHY